MSTVLAALDASVAAQPVLETALRIGEMTGHDVRAVHVIESSTDSPELLLRQGRVGRAALPLD